MEPVFGSLPLAGWRDVLATPRASERTGASAYRRGVEAALAYSHIRGSDTEKRMIRFAALIVTVLAASVGQSWADNVTSFKPETLAAVLTLKSYSDVKLGTDSSGDPRIEGTAENVPFAVLFYGCTDHKNCPFIQLIATLPNTAALTPEKINEWTAGFVMPAHIFSTDNGAIRIADVLYLEPGGGMPSETFAANFAAFIAGVQHALTYFQ